MTTRRLAWLLGLSGIGLLAGSAVMLAQVPDLTNGNWLEAQVASIVTIGAVIVGIVILNRQPRQRIGWLWILYGIAVGFRVLGHAVYYTNGARSTGYSPLEYFLLWFTEPANLTGFVCLILLLLWFPAGELVSRRWRFLYIWWALAMGGLVPSLFLSGTNWNGGQMAGGILIENPFGLFQGEMFATAAALGFFSIVLILLLAAVSLLIRYRSAGEPVRLQLRWFIFGGFFLVLLSFATMLFGLEGSTEVPGVLVLSLLGFSGIVPLYLSVGVAILRYRLYDIDLIIRRTLQYTLLTGFLALFYFAGVVVLQGVFGGVTGERDSPLVTVVTTLAIAALFSPLRRRTQEWIDRRFYRKNYDAERALARFAATARHEVDMDRLMEAVFSVVADTMQPVKVSTWLVPGDRERKR